jgi:16S rRNA (uracil1498-N3)-methyltransferase
LLLCALKRFLKMHVFHSVDIEGQTILLDAEESKHAIRVLRLVAGDAVLVLDGSGNSYRCTLTEAQEKRAVLNIDSILSTDPRPVKINLAIAPTKSSDRLEWMVEKATELGVDGIYPVICNRSEKRRLNTDRIRKIVTAACKQSRNPWFPTIHEPMEMRPYLNLANPGFIAHCMDGDQTNIQNINVQQHQEVNLLIGPEGDFTPDEVELATQKGWMSVSLGANRLRTETAGLFAVAAVVLKTRCS